MPSRFADPMEEYRAVRSHVGLLDLSHRALLCFTGADRVSFLHGIVSNDVKILADGTGTAAAFLNVHGKILADARIFAAADSLIVDLWAFLKEKILDHVNRYLIADEVEIADLSHDWAILSFQGPDARPLVSELLQDTDLPTQEHHHRRISLNGTELRVVRASHTGEEGYDLMAAIPTLLSLMPGIEELRKKFSGRWIGSQALDTLRIEAGIPRYGVDMDEDNLLLETGLDQAFSFQKGCYLGQEVVERIRSRGHVNRKLTGIVLEGGAPPDPGSRIYAAEKEIGRVTSSIVSPLLARPIALGYVHRDYLSPGTQVRVQREGEAITAAITALPFSARGTHEPTLESP